MATDKKISQLSSGAPAQAGDEYVVARSGANYKLTGSNVAALVAGTANTFSATQTFSNPAEFADGSASAPAVTNTGDTNTGVYFPAADEVAVSAGGTVAAGFNSNGLFFRNRIINGDMRIDQRNAGASVTVNNTGGNFGVDRFFATGQSADGVFTVQRSSVAPEGFKNSLLATVTTADASIGASQIYVIAQRIEGFNIADLGWGAAGAQTVTLSFWVRSSLTGTFGGSITNETGYSYPFTYTISAANTFEKKTVTITGATAGTWLTTNGVGATVVFTLGSGTTFTGAAGSWSANVFYGATGQTQVIGTLNATWYVTGVQLETGSVATPFERRPYGTELQLCQRYCQKLAGDTAYTVVVQGSQSSTTGGVLTYNFGNPMRASPTATFGTIADFYARNYAIVSNLATFTLDTGVSSTKETASFLATWGGAGAAAGAGIQIVSGANAPKVILSAEL